MTTLFVKQKVNYVYLVFVTTYYVKQTYRGLLYIEGFFRHQTIWIPLIKYIFSPCTFNHIWGSCESGVVNNITRQ